MQKQIMAIKRKATGERYLIETSIACPTSLCGERLTDAPPDDIARASTNKVRKAAKEADVSATCSSTSTFKISQHVADSQVAYARFRKALDDKRKEFAENEKEMKRILGEFRAITIEISEILG
jgi:hypothetical protein